MTPVSAPGALVEVGVVHVYACEKPTPVAELLALLRSTTVPVTLAVSGYPPVAPGVTVKVTVAVALGAIVPKRQVTVVVPLQDPWLGVEVTSVSPLGNVSVSVALVADGPLLVTVMV